MSRLDDIRARVDCYAEGTTGREDRAYLLELVDEARNLLREWRIVGAPDGMEWDVKIEDEGQDTEAVVWNDAYRVKRSNDSRTAAWLAKVDP